MTSSKVQSRELNNNDNNDSNNNDDITTTTATSASTTTPCNTAKTTTSTYINTSSLSYLFDTITSMVQNSSPPLPLSDESKLQLYGLYKRCTAGTTTSSTATAPSKWNIVAYRKYVAWEECNEFTLEESMICYIELVSSLECDLGHECLLLLEEFKTEKELHNTQKNIFCNDDSNDDKNSINQSETMTKTMAKKSTLSSIKSKKEILNSSISSTTTKSASLFTKFTGIQPFTPRGQLDISSSDLLFALFKSMPLPLPIFNNVANNTSSMRTIVQLEEDISKSWKEENNNKDNDKDNDKDKDNSCKDHIIAGLSVRSLLDLYLTAKSYPNDSEVIIIPPISIEGLMDVIQYHGIKIIPIDIDGDGDQHSHPIIKVDIDKVKKAITTKTVGILIVHPFGLVCMNDEEMKELKGVVDDAMGDVNNKIELWEDCAECFTGGVGHGHGYSGSKYVDVQFFSFGMIKTATALGGGIAVIKQDDLVNNENNTDLTLDQKEVAEKMKRLQHMNYEEQSQREYLIKICKALLLHLVSRNLILSGILIRFMDFFGVDYDRFVTSSIKGFPTKEIKSTTDRELVEQKKDRGRELIQRLRKRPCLALLSLLHRRIIKSKSTRKTIGSRITRCEKMEALLKEHCPSIHIPIGSDTSQHLFWLFPFLVNDPTAVCQYMKKRGFDVPRGTSQLGCVTSFLIDSKHASSCPNTERMMNNILYLPIASAAMTTSDMHQMSIALRDAIKYTSESSNKGCDENIEMKNNNRGKCNIRLQFTMVLVTLLIFDGSVSCMLPFSSTFFSLARTFVEICIPWTLSSICVLLVIIHIVRSTIGSYYINCSNAYAKYNSIFHESSTNSPKSVLPTLNGTGLKIVNCSDSYKQSDDLFESKIFDLPNLKQSSANGSSDKLVLLTGGTGFIGSLLLRYLLFHRSQLGINGVVLICRSKRQLSAVQRVEKMMEKPMFSFLNDQEKKDLVIVINGDVASPNIGMTENDSQRLCQELNITHVFNCAACVNFTEPLENAAESNITSALQLQQFTKKLRNKHAIYIYLSTAFIHGCQNGTKDNPLAEELFDFGKYNPVELYESMMNTQSCASKAMHDLGFPNTYTFSKSICEHLLMNKKDLQTIIIRPSIVGPSIQEPFEGWAGDKPSTLVAGACLYMKNPYNLWTFRRETSPVIPVDVVCRFVLAKAFQKPLEMVPFTSKNDDDVSKSSEESCRSSELSYVFTKSSTMKSYLSETDSSQCLSDESVDRHQQIFTAAWDSKSNASSGFLWYDFACAIVQLSSANGHVELSLAYFVLLVSFKIFLAMNLTFVTFSKVHKILVHGPFHVVKYLCRMLGLNPKILKDFDKLGPFLDLPLLFFPFTTSTYYFDSDLVAPTSINGERYMFSCILAAEKFVMSINEKMSKGKDRMEKLNTKSSSSLLIAGGKHKRLSSDIWWALTQPKGSYTIRLIGLIISKILRHTTTEVTVDMTSLAQLARAIEESTDKTKPYLILAPTHRSFFDFILLSFLSFSVPEFGISTPHIAAADDFSRIPVLGWFAQMAGAFFLTRGKGIADPGLKSKVTALKDQHSMENPSCIEVFLEGKRSRDRRFLEPKTGFLRCLCETGGKHLLIPITINYEAIPEQSGLAMEADGLLGTKMCISKLFFWLKKVYSGEVNLGRIHISLSDPMLMKPSPQLEVAKVARLIQKHQQRKVHISMFHLKASANVLNVGIETIQKALQLFECPFWSQNDSASLRLPISLTEKWTIFLQIGHIFSPFLRKSHPKWASWLNPCDDDLMSVHESNEHVLAIVRSLVSHFDAADLAVENTIKLLCGKGFTKPSFKHIVQYTNCRNHIPLMLINAAASMGMDTLSLRGKEQTEMKSSVIRPLFRGTRETSARDDQMNFIDVESFGAWGYKDSKFVVGIQRDGSKCVTMNGDRYNISGKPMPNLIPFLERETNVKVDITNTSLSCTPGVSITDCDLSTEDIQLLLREVKNEKKRVSTAPLDRARHGTGHSQEDMYIIRSNSLSNMRLPDVVVFPDKESEVAGLISLAAQKQWCLIPFGGGTNVSHATWCPSKDIDPRPMISVDMRLMNKILKVNEEDSTVHVQAGITGGQLVREMQSLGFTIGHEPDSIEFSTVGGWIATNSSGMKQNKYGNIEDIVKEVRVANSQGLMWQHNSGNGASFGRVSTGTDLTSLVLGSEGSLGLITSAVLKIWPLPAVKEYQSVILHNFEDGIRFVKDVAKLGIMKPASIRLLDNTQFRLGQAMKPNSSLVGSLKKTIMKAYASLKVGEFHACDMVCATVTFEGSMAEVEIQQKFIRDLASKHGGLCAGQEIGKAGYDMTYAIAYIRDFAMTYAFLAESFETFVPWSKVAKLIIATKDRLRKEHSDRALPGRPIVCCRITQLYDEGVCVYFYFCMNFENVNDASAVFSDIELAARREILCKGGSLSHHHGIGKAKASLMDHVNSENLKNVLMKVKEAFDPENIFGARNGSYA